MTSEGFNIFVFLRRQQADVEFVVLPPVWKKYRLD